MKSETNPIVVVVGHDHQNTLGVIRSLGEAGFQVQAVLLTQDNRCSTASSKYLDHSVAVRPSELTEALIQLGEAIRNPVALIPCGDDTVAAISKDYERLMEFFILPGVGNGERMLRLMNKIEMLTAAQHAGLNVPRWFSFRDTAFENLQEHCAQLRFPVIVKPVELKPGGKFEFRIAKNPEELNAALDYVRSNCTSAIFQEYIQKVAEFGVNGCRLSRSGETIFGGVIRKKRFSQSAMGSTTAGTIAGDPGGLCDAVRQLVEHVDYRGIFDVEFLFDGTSYYFVEINFRNGGYGYAYTRAGRNYPAMWALEACGADFSDHVSKQPRPIRFINESADLQNVLARNVSLFGWLWDVLTADAHMYINRNDMQPMLRKIRGR